MFNKASGVIVDYSKDRIRHASEMASQSFYSLLGETSSDIAVIANSPTLREYVANPSEEAQSGVNQLFYTTLKNKPSYFQIRWIGVEDNGKEIIRYDRISDTIIKSDTLQEKGDREYFQKTLEIGAEEYYFSQINLNEEYGVISEPYTPTLRAASPIFDTNSEIRGILVINVVMSKLYENFKQISRNNSEFYLVDQNGEYLFSPDENEEFASQKGKINNFFTDFKTNKSELTSQNQRFDTLHKNDRTFLSFIKELEYFNGRRKIYLISSVEQETLMESALMVRSYSLRTLVIVCLISLIISLIFTSFLSQKIIQITRAISNYDKEIDKEIELPVKRKDEIGVLASAFSTMKMRIDKNVKELNESLGKEKEAKKQRDEFLQNMSHEMRTPLNTILGLTQILYKQSPSESQLPIIKSLEKSANNLAGLVYDVLDHQKLVEGKLQINFQPVDISKLLQDIYSNYKFEAAKKGLKFDLNIDESLKNIRFNTDPLRLSQIITNLVVNAIKYTREGEIKLYAQKIQEADKSFLKIRVKDTGIGIEEENINRINDRFFRENEEVSFRNSGYGLGLSIVKQLTELFGGEFKAKSIKTVGSEFCVKIPLGDSVGDPLVDTPKVENNIFQNFTQKNDILFIEDDISTIELVKHILNNEHIVLNQVSSKEEALNFIETRSPDLIISDLMLNDQNLEADISHWLNSQIVKCPMIITSALEPGSTKNPHLIYFQKPYNVDYFKDYVFQKLGEKEFTCPDFSSIYSNYDNDQEKINKVLKLLQEEFKIYLERIFEVFDNQDQKEWKAINHKLITHINNLNLSELREILPEEATTMDRKKLEELRSLFAFYLCCFRNERNINLKDRFS